ncbi:MAG: hypothetical protein AAF623_15330 [Planctomycetota bacterium]
MANPSAIVLGASPTGLAVVWSLGPQKIGVHVADYQSDRPAFASKFRQGKPITGSTDEQVIDAVINIAESLPEPPIVIPTSDAMVLALVNYRDKYKGKLITFPAIESGLAEPIVDKASFYKMCLDNDVPTAKTAFTNSVDEILGLADEFQFPLLLKPVFGHLWRDRLKGKKLLVAQDRQQLEKTVEKFGDDASGLMVQELIPGSEKDIWVGAMYRGLEGKRDVCFVGQKTRQYPVDFGSASYATSIYVPEVEEASWKFLEGIDYRGICGTEFKYDRRDSQYKMIEVNPRPTLWFHLAKSAGVELLHYAYCDLAGLPKPEIKKQKDGVHWCLRDKDILTWGHHLKKFDVNPFSLLTTFSPFNHGGLISLSDPGPFLSLPMYYARRIKERFGKKS